MISYLLLLLTVTVSQTLFIADPKIPFFTNLGSGLAPGNKIIITGLINQAAHNFAINLRKGYEQGYGNDVTIPLHFNPRFFQPDYVVLNTHLAGVGWLREERTSTTVPIPFVKGYPFLIEIVCGENQFHISVDGQHFYDYSYRLPLEDATALEITGASQLEVYMIDVLQDEVAA